MKRPGFLSLTGASRAKSHLPFEVRISRRRPERPARCRPKRKLSVRELQKSSQPDLPRSRSQAVPQQGDIQDKLASVGIHGDEADSILNMYGLDPRAENVPENAQDAAGKPWNEQVRDAYSTLADQRGIPVNSNDDLFRDQDTARDARNAVEQVISHVYPEAAGGERGRMRQSPPAQIYSREAISRFRSKR